MQEHTPYNESHPRVHYNSRTQSRDRGDWLVAMEDQQMVRLDSSQQVTNTRSFYPGMGAVSYTLIHTHMYLLHIHTYCTSGLHTTTKDTHIQVIHNMVTLWPTWIMNHKYKENCPVQCCLHGLATVSVCLYTLAQCGACLSELFICSRGIIITSQYAATRKPYFTSLLWKALYFLMKHKHV